MTIQSAAPSWPIRAFRLAGLVVVVGLASAFRDIPDGPEMVAIPGAAFALARTEITFDDWQACVGAGGCRGGQDDHGWGRGQRPVINVTWGDATAYARWLAHRTGQAYDLPTEAEWELAARAGTTTAYWWGEEPGQGHANCRGCGSAWDGRGTAPVGSFPPNPFGLYDMNGNVWEWVLDCWQPPAAGGECPAHTIRGGSWYYFPEMARAGARAKMDIRQWSYNLGFRVIRRGNPKQ